MMETGINVEGLKRISALQDEIIQLKYKYIDVLEENRELEKRLDILMGKRKKAPVLQMIRGGKESPRKAAQNDQSTDRLSSFSEVSE